MNTSANDKFVGREIKVDADLVRKILDPAAHLIAAMRDPNQGEAEETLSLEVKDSLEDPRGRAGSSGIDWMLIKRKTANCVSG